jgi:HEAT repeat protein
MRTLLINALYAILVATLTLVAPNDCLGQIAGAESKEAAAARTGNAVAMSEALVYLGHTDDARAVPSLVRLLSDPTPDVRARAAMLLGAVGRGAHDAVGALRPLLRDSSRLVRQEAVFAAGAIGANDSLTADELVRLARDESASIVAARARRALEQLPRFGLITPGHGATATVEQFLRDSSWRVDGIALLDKLRVPWKEDTLLALLADRNVGVRVTAAFALANMGADAVRMDSALALLRADTTQAVRDRLPAIGTAAAKLSARRGNWDRELHPRGAGGQLRSH